MSERLWHLKCCELFERLPDEALAHLERHARFRKFPRRNPIYLPADESTGVLLLSSGRAKICNFTADGKQAILAFVEPGELFGELALLEGGPRDEYAEAVEPSTVVLIPRQTMNELMEAHPSLSLGITRLVGLRRRRIERRLKYLLFQSNRQRLVHLLLELAEQYGRPGPDGVSLGIRLSHQDLASIIGSTRETVTITLGELQAEGVLRVARRQIVIRDLRRLADSVEVEPPTLPVQRLHAPSDWVSATSTQR